MGGWSVARSDSPSLLVNQAPGLYRGFHYKYAYQETLFLEHHTAQTMTDSVIKGKELTGTKGATIDEAYAFGPSTGLIKSLLNVSQLPRPL